MSDISANRTDLISRRPGELPADAHGQKAAREAQASALPSGPVSRPLQAGAGPLDRPSGRPGEPVTAGLPTGPGRGYEPPPRRSEKGLAELRALLRVSRDPMLAIMIGRIEEREGL